jgi:hemolysin activation/secretion protein
LGEDLELGLFSSFSRVKLGEDFEDVDARGKTTVYGLFINKPLVDTENLTLGLNLGFDYKDITNYQLQTVTSTDRMRVVKCGLDMDLTDTLGRTLISNELDFGIPDIMGGLRKQDTKASRTGSGGKFVKNTINLLRLQKMPFSSSLLWKNQIQLSPYILTATEQFQIGGIANVRGYPPAEAVGDKGYSMTFEWSFPPYLLPKNIKVPFSKAKAYDALRFAMFYDWANTQLRRPTATEEKNKTLRGAGWGLRFNLPEDFSIRLDFGWPLDNTPSDSDHIHPWIQISKTF